MASIDAWYNSSSRPEYRPPEETCPIKEGDEFGGIITVRGIPPQSTSRWITVGFYLDVLGYKEWCYNYVYLYPYQEDASVYVTSHGFTVFDPHGLAVGRTIDTRKEAVFGNQIPGITSWHTFASDGDADVYVNRTEPPIPLLFDVSRPESSYW